MMLGRIIGAMLRCVKKKENFFVTFYSQIFIFIFHLLKQFLGGILSMLQCSIKSDYHARSNLTRMVPSIWRICSKAISESPPSISIIR